jgi:hypothetical protein
MKTLVLALLFSSILFTPILSAGVGPKAQLNSAAIADNLTKGIKSDNEGLRISSASMIQEIIGKSVLGSEEFSGSLIPLLRMLDYGNEIERMTAALTIYSLDNGIGIYRLRGAAKFDQSEKVRTVSKNLYYGYHTIHNSTCFLDF